MKLNRYLACGFLGLICANSSVFSAAFQFYELGTPVIGSAGVGQAALASDASTAYFNPAGMASLSVTQFMLGSQIMLPYQSFAANTRTTIAGNNGGNAGQLTPGVGMFYVYDYAPKLKFGLSFSMPYGGQLTYSDGWAGRYLTQNILLYTLNLNPSFAYQLNRWFAFGAGVAMEYAYLHQNIALPETGADGQVNIKTSSFAPGFNVGFLLTPTANTKIGLAYRSQIIHHLHGDITFLNIGANPNVRTKIVMPQNIILSIVDSLNKRFTLLAEAGWANWASMKSSTLTVDGFSVTIPQNWINTYRVGLGGQVNATEHLLLQAGVSLDSSPTSSSRRTPELPMDRQLRIGAGLIYTPVKEIQLGFAYEYINLGAANINNLSSLGFLSGSYARSYVNVVQASINVAC